MADISIVMSSDEQRVMRALDKVIQKEKELALKAAEVGQTTTRATRQAEDGFEKMARGAVNAARSLVPWTSATDVLRAGMEGVLQVLDRIVERQKEAARFVGSSASGLESLGQLAGGDQARMGQLMGHVRRVYPTVGGPDMNAAARLVNDVVAAGFEDEGTIDLAAQLHHTLGGEAGKAATGIAGLQKSMGIGETGDFRLLMAKAVEAAKTAPGGVPEVLKYVAKSGGTARALGVSDEELFAAFATTAASASNPEMGGTQLSALLTKFAAHGRTGGIMENVGRISREGVPVTEGSGRNARTRMSREIQDVTKWLGSDEAFRAYSALSLNADEVRAGTTAMRGVTPIDLAGAGAIDPTIRAERISRGALATEALSAERQGQIRRVAEAGIAENAAGMRASGYPEAIVQTETWLREAQLNNPLFGAFMRAMLPGEVGKELDFNERAAERLDRIAENTRGPSPRVLPGADR